MEEHWRGLGLLAVGLIGPDSPSDCPVVAPHGHRMPREAGLTCLRMASRSWSCTRSSRRWMRVRRVLRGSEKRLKKLS